MLKIDRGGAARAAVAAAVGVLVLAGAPVATADEPTDHFSNVCERKAGGRTLRVLVESVFTFTGSNDLKRVRLRATDDAEKGDYRNSHVKLTELKVVVKPHTGAKKVKTAGRSPLTISLDPTSKRSGKEAAYSEARVTWLVDGKRTVTLTCADIDT